MSFCTDKGEGDSENARRILPEKRREVNAVSSTSGPTIGLSMGRIKVAFASAVVLVMMCIEATQRACFSAAY